MLRRRLKKALGLSILKLFNNVPRIILLTNFFIGLSNRDLSLPNIYFQTIYIPLELIDLYSYIYIFTTFRLFLENQYGFYKVSDLIIGITFLRLIISGSNILGNIFLLDKNLMYQTHLIPLFLCLLVGMITMVLIGIVYIILGIKLLKSYSNLKINSLFDYLIIITGICYGTVLFSVIGILTASIKILILTVLLSVIGTLTEFMGIVILGVTFFHTTKEEI